jgi:bloom syndrome protein
MAPSKKTQQNQYSALGPRILEKARQAAKEDGYDSAKARADMAAEFLTRYGKEAYSWQLDVAEAFLLKVDSLLIAGTGMGKTIPFMLPLLVNPRTPGS